MSQAQAIERKRKQRQLAEWHRLLELVELEALPCGRSAQVRRQLVLELSEEIYGSADIPQDAPSETGDKP